MDIDSFEKESLIRKIDFSDIGGLSNLDVVAHHNTKQRFSRSTLLYSLFISIALNIVFSLAIFTRLIQKPQCRSQFTGLDYNATSSYQIYTDYINPNRSISDQLWESLDSSPIMVALDAEYTTNHNLKPSIPFPWDSSKGLYHIKAFHHIHCLKNIRYAYLSALTSSPSTQPLIASTHILHCLDTLRQDLMCHADDTPMPTVQEPHKIGDRQSRKCRDWDALVAWTQAPERQACFKMIDEYREVPNSLEEFAFCPEGSKYQSNMEAYFARWGHRDPYGGKLDRVSMWHGRHA